MSSNLQKARTPAPDLKFFVHTAIKVFLFTLVWIPIYLTRCVLIKVVQKVKPNYGKILDHDGAAMSENYCSGPPKNSLVFTMVLNGHLSLQVLKQLFRDNILNAKIHNKISNQDELRYPEFTQYQVDLAGYTFWKDDPAFNIDNHIIEKSYNGNFKSSRMRIHQYFTNKSFPERRSPWEILMVSEYLNNPDKTLIILRNHHTLGDTKSILKVIVEGLGEKKLKLPPVQYLNTSYLDKIQYYVLLPFYFVYVQVLGHFVALKGDTNPWKFREEEEPLLNVCISKRVPMSEVKAIAKKHRITTSAVIMAAVAGGVAKSDSRQTRIGIPCQWVLPRQNHPDKLTSNYSYLGTMELPTNISSTLERLHRCNDIFAQFKSSNLPKYGKDVLFQVGTWFSPLRKTFLRNTSMPLVITNVASDGDGFEVGSVPCSEFTMTCAPHHGACGAIICLFSYKDGIEMTATTKKGLFSEAQTQKLVDLMAKEFEMLKKL